MTPYFVVNARLAAVAMIASAWSPPSAEAQ